MHDEFLRSAAQEVLGNDLSLKMFLILSAGIGLWVLYGILQKDTVIILANAISLCFLAGILYLKLKSSR